MSQLENDGMLKFEDAYIRNGEMWFVSYSRNALMRMDMKTKIAKCVGSFPNEKMSGYRLYSKIIEYNDKLYFVPCRAEEIGVYDLANKCFEKIPYECEEVGKVSQYSGWNFYAGCEYGRNIYFFPHQRTAILKYDTQKNQLHVLNDWYKDFESVLEDSSSLFFNIDVVGSKAYLPLNYQDSTMVFDMENDSAIIINFESGNEGYIAAKACNDMLCVAPLNGNSIVLYDMKTENIKKIELDNEKDKCDYYFWSMELVNNHIYCIPNQYKYIMNINITDCTADKIDIDLYKNNLGESRFICSKVVDDKIFLCSNMGELVDISNVNEKSLMLIENDEAYKEYFELLIEDNLKRGEVVEESNGDMFKYWLSYLKKEKSGGL